MWRSHERESVEFRCTMDVDEAVMVDTHLGKLPSLEVPGHLPRRDAPSASRCPDPTNGIRSATATRVSIRLAVHIW